MSLEELQHVDVRPQVLRSRRATTALPKGNRLCGHTDCTRHLVAAEARVLANRPPNVWRWQVASGFERPFERPKHVAQQYADSC
jgi:hypothetical protein